MASVLLISAFQFSDPITVFVKMKIDDLSGNPN
jgi:hypothetical protein